MKPKSSRREKQMSIRVVPKWYVKMVVAAESMGLDVSTWVRVLIAHELRQIEESKMQWKPKLK